MTDTLDVLQADLKWLEREIDQYAGNLQKKYMDTELKDLVAQVTEDESMTWSRMIEVVSDCWKWDGLDVPDAAFEELSGELEELYSMLHNAESYREDIEFELDALPY